MPQAVARRIQDMIRGGTYAPDERLPSQRELAEQLGASRASVREALLSLETLGLVRTLPARGTFVTGPTVRALVTRLPFREINSVPLNEVYATRAVLEGELAATAATGISDGALTGIRDAQQQFRKLYQEGDLIGHVEADLSFHRQIAAASPNGLLNQIYESLIGMMTESQRSPIPMTDNTRMERSIQEHERIVAALAARDPAQSGAAMRAHIRATAACAGITLPPVS